MKYTPHKFKTMNAQQIKQQLENNITALRNAYYTILALTNQEGKQQYGSLAEFKLVKNNLQIQIQTLNTFAEWIEENDCDIEDTPDIMDMGLNDYSYEDLLNKSFGK